MKFYIFALQCCCSSCCWYDCSIHWNFYAIAIFSISLFDLFDVNWICLANINAHWLTKCLPSTVAVHMSYLSWFFFLILFCLDFVLLYPIIYYKCVNFFIFMFSIFFIVTDYICMYVHTYIYRAAGVAYIDYELQKSKLRTYFEFILC